MEHRRFVLARRVVACVTRDNGQAPSAAKMTMRYDGTTAEARITRCRLGYTVNVHEHWLAYEMPAWRLTRRGAERKGRRMLARWRRHSAVPDVVGVIR